MDEFWLCERCRSKVQASADRCDRCGFERGRYRPVGLVGSTLCACFVALLALDLLRYWAETVVHGLDGSSGALLPDLAGTLSSLLDAMRLVEPLFGLVVGSLWFVFLATSMANARTLLPADDAAALPHWDDSLLAWAIPLRNLRRPYADVRELYVRLGVPGSAGAAIVRGWWIAWLGWLAVVYLPIFVQGFEVLVAFAGAAVAAMLGSNPQPHWTWITQPYEMVVLVALAAVVGPASILLGGAPIVPPIAVPDFPATLPGVAVLGDLRVLLSTARFIGEVAFVAAIVLWLRLVLELSRRQQVRLTMLHSPSPAAGRAAFQQ